MHPLNRFLLAVRKRPRVALALLFVLLVGALWGGFLQAKRLALERVDLIFDAHRQIDGNYLDRLIETPLLVPEVLTKSSTVRALISRPSPTAASELSVMLEEVARDVQVDVIYVMDVNGNTLAASNWRAQDSFVGHNYKFRPYFQQAIAGRSGRYTAKGITSLKVGHYLARPVTVDGKIRGVVVVKISFEQMQSRLEDLWHRDKDMDLVTDENGVVILSPVSALTFKLIQPIPETIRKAIEASRQYGTQALSVSMTKENALNGRLRLVDFKDIPEQSFLQTSYSLPQLGLRLYLNIPASRYWAFVAEFTAMFALAALVILLVGISVFQRAAYAADLIEAAIHDPLTGLNTRLYMNEWCGGALNAHNRDPRAGVGLAVFDLDLFKQINDIHGHLAGDAVLRRVGEIIRTAVRREDLAVRFGGEELAVFVRYADLAEAVALAERIRLHVEQTEFKANSGKIHVTLSGGVACHATGEALDALFARADAKLYEAKELGRNRIAS